MITATTTTRNGETFTETFDTEHAARRFCVEEVKWESTARVVCEAISFDQAGDFA
jgi:hypothetical protein